MGTLRKPILGLLHVTAVGFILMFYSELMHYNPMQPALAPSTAPLREYGVMLAVYSLEAAVLIWLVRRYRVNGLWGLVLAGSAFGWLLEGMVVSTMYDNFPYYVAWTGLAWHLPLDVLAGYWLMRRMLAARSWQPAALGALALGGFWGWWATWGWSELGVQPPAAGFMLDALGAGALLAGAYWLADVTTATQPWQPPPPLEWTLGVLLALVHVASFVGHALAKPLAWVVLPPLLALLYLGLHAYRCRSLPHGRLFPDNARPVPAARYLLVLLMPLCAGAVYWLLGLLPPMLLPANVVVFTLGTLAGWLALGIALVKALRPAPVPRGQGVDGVCTSH